MTRRLFWIILGLGAFLRLFLLWLPGLWYDENFSLVLARLPFARMLAATMGDVHPPLSYIPMWLLGQIPGLAPWLLRLPAALASIGALALYPRLMRGLRVPGRVQAVAFAMLALLPMQLHYAQEARMYALLELLIVGAVICIIEDRPGLLALSCAGLLYTQNYGAFYVAAILGVIGLMWHYDRRAIGRLPAKHALDLWAHFRADVARRYELQAAAVIIGGLLWLPWLPIAIKQTNFINANYWIFDMSLGGLLYEVWKVFWAFSLSHPAGLLSSMLVTFGWILLGLWYLFAKRPLYWPVIAVLCLGPAIMALAVSFALQPIFLFRPLIGITPFLYLMCAYPLGKLDTLRGQLFAACFTVPLIVTSIGGYYAYLPQQKVDSGTGNVMVALDYINAHWRPGDLIIEGSAAGWINLGPYTDKPQYALPACAVKAPGAISPATAAAIEIPTIEAVPASGRVFYVAVIGPGVPDCEVQRTEAITGGLPPTVTLQETKYLLSGIWVIGGQ